MTKDQTIEALEACRERLHWFSAAVGEPIDTIRSSDPKDPIDIMNHCLWMIDTAIGFLHEGRKEKAMRWLGFIQGAMWCAGIETIDNLKHFNKYGRMVESEDTLDSKPSAARREGSNPSPATICLRCTVSDMKKIPYGSCGKDCEEASKRHVIVEYVSTVEPISAKDLVEELSSTIFIKESKDSIRSSIRALLERGWLELGPRLCLVLGNENNRVSII